MGPVLGSQIEEFCRGMETTIETDLREFFPYVKAHVCKNLSRGINCFSIEVWTSWKTVPTEENLLKFRRDDVSDRKPFFYDAIIDGTWDCPSLLAQE